MQSAARKSKYTLISDKGFVIDFSILKENEPNIFHSEGPKLFDLVDSKVRLFS